MPVCFFLLRKKYSRNGKSEEERFDKTRCLRASPDIGSLKFRNVKRAVIKSFYDTVGRIIRTIALYVIGDLPLLIIVGIVVYVIGIFNDVGYSLFRCG